MEAEVFLNLQIGITLVLFSRGATKCLLSSITLLSKLTLLSITYLSIILSLARYIQYHKGISRILIAPEIVGDILVR